MPRAPPTSRMVSLMALPGAGLVGGHRGHDGGAGRRHDQAHAGAHDRDGHGDRRVGGVHARGGQVEQADAHQRHPGRDDHAGAEAAGQDRRQRRDGPHGQRERQRAQPGGQRAVAVHQLQVLGQHEQAAEQGEEDHGHRRGGGGEGARRRTPAGRSAGARMRSSHQANAASAASPAAISASVDRRGPAAAGRLDDRVDDARTARPPPAACAEDVQPVTAGLGGLGHGSEHAGQRDARPAGR